ncbi:MAG: hypothetical protein ACSHWS_07750 [Sulfitobacter sp.]
MNAEGRHANAIDWAGTLGNLALTQRWLADVTDNLRMLTTARKNYATSEALDFCECAPFDRASLQWSIADLALAHFRLDPDPVLLTDARSHVSAARAFFVEGSDYQT